MKRVKIKKMIPKGSSGEDVKMLNVMFDQMTGASQADPDILKPKYKKIRKNLRKFCKVFELFINFKGCANVPECQKGFSEIKTFINSMKEMHNLNINVNEDDKIIKEMGKDEINAAYDMIKNSPEVQKIIITGGRLMKNKKYIEDKSNLSDDFIRREPGLSLMPFSFSSLDLKQIWASENLNDISKKYILRILSHVYELGYDIYDTVTSPNVNIKEFSNILINNIGMLKKQIPRCNKAFGIIADSVKMLETNFKSYYKTSVEAENPSIIIESFIVDVSMKQKSNAEVTRQFRKIIMHMKRKSTNNNDPRVKKLFSILNNQFSMMEKDIPKYEDEDENEKLEKEPKKEK